MESSDDPGTPNLESILDAVAAYRHKRDELLRHHRTSGRPYAKAFTKDWKQSSEEFGLGIRKLMENATNADIDALVQQMDRESRITSRDAWLALKHASPISFHRLKYHFLRLKRSSGTRCNLRGLCRDILVRDPDYFLQVIRSDCLEDRHFVANLAVADSLASRPWQRLEEFAAPIVLSWRVNEASEEIEFVLSWFNRASVLFRELLDPMALGDDEADRDFALQVYSEHRAGNAALFSLLERKRTSSQNRISILAELERFFERKAEYQSWTNVMLTPEEHEVVFGHVDSADKEIRLLATRLLSLAGCPKREDVQQFFLTLADHREADFRVLAIPGFVRMGEVDSVVAKHYLEELLDDSSSSVRSAAISGLAELEKVFSSIRDSLERMLRDSEASVRSAAALAIGDLTIGPNSRCESVVEALLDCFTDHHDDEYCILVALGNIGAPMASVAAGPLLESIKREGDHRHFGSTRLLETLCKIGVPSLELDVEPILYLIGRGNEVELAVKALRTIAPEKLPVVIPKLVELLDNSWKREEAIKALGNAGAKAVETTPKVIRQLECSQVKIQIAALETLGKIGSNAASRILPVLVRHFDSETPAIAVAAIRAAGLIGPPEDHELAEILKRRLLTSDQVGETNIFTPGLQRLGELGVALIRMQITLSTKDQTRVIRTIAQASHSERNLIGDAWGWEIQTITQDLLQLASAPSEASDFTQELATSMLRLAHPDDHEAIAHSLCDSFPLSCTDARNAIVGTLATIGVYSPTLVMVAVERLLPKLAGESDFNFLNKLCLELGKHMA